MLPPRFLRTAMFAALVAPTWLSAQAGAPRIPSGCTYETCALRVEPAFLSAPKLVRGRAGEEVGGIGMFGGNVDVLLAGPDSAAAYAHSYVTNQRRSSTLGLIGTAALIVAIVRSDNFRDPDGTTTAFAITSVGFALASIPSTVRASRSLSRAIWWYNSALPTR